MIWIKNFYFIQIVSGDVTKCKIPETNMNIITTPSPLRIAVIGGGISGMGAAYQLSHFGKVALYESEVRLGGHGIIFLVRKHHQDLEQDLQVNLLVQLNHQLLDRGGKP